MPTKPINLADGQVAYYGVPPARNTAAVQIALTSGAVTAELQSSIYDAAVAPLDMDETAAGNEHFWAPESAITVAVPTAPGSTMNHLSRVGSNRLRIKLTAAGVTLGDVLTSSQ